MDFWKFVEKYFELHLCWHVRWHLGIILRVFEALRGAGLNPVEMVSALV